MKLEYAIAKIRMHQPRALPASGVSGAAVLIPMRVTATDDVEVIFTRRAENLVTHAGQVSFPGGMIEAADATPEDAALRETEEELGIAKQHVAIVGRLDDLVTPTMYHIVPVVGVVDPAAEIRANAEEVARVFAVSLPLLLEEKHWELRTHHFGSHTVQLWHFPFEGEDIWGATAFMLRGFIDLLK